MNYHKITKHDIANGTGVRVVLWLSGCSHHCYNCQNPQTWNKDSGDFFDIEAEQELFNALSQSYVAGLTLSGGDSLYSDNLDDVYQLLLKVKNQFPDKTIWLYTGYTWESIQHPIVTGDFNLERDYMIELRRKIISLCDVLVDGKYKEELKDITLKFRGSSNQRIIDIQKTLKTNEIVLYDL